MDWIDNVLLEINDIYGTDNIYELYEYLNIEIVKLDPVNILLNGNEAFYNRDYFGNEVVFIKNNLNRTFEKFILAHELGHALLHTNLYEAAFRKDLINSGKFERQADYFASKFLNINLMAEEYEDLTLEQIASCLEVPERALRQLANI